MKKILFLLTIVIPVMMSCEKDSYIIGGEKNETNKVDMTTFDFLASTDYANETAEVLALAGLKDVVNGNVTLFAPSNYAVRRYLRRLTNKALRLDPNAAKVTINDISADSLRKYMGMYIVDGKFTRDEIPEEGLLLATHKTGDSIRVTLDKTTIDPIAGWDGGGTPGQGYQYTNFMQSVPYLIHVHFKRGNKWEMTPQQRSALNPESTERDQVYRMYISDVVTSTGVVHVIYCGDYNYSDHYYYHTLFFFGTTNDDRL